MNLLCDRLRSVREENFGEHGVPMLAAALGMTSRAWLGYESGGEVPVPVVLGLVVLVGIEPNWLLTGEGERY